MYDKTRPTLKGLNQFQELTFPVFGGNPISPFAFPLPKARIVVLFFYPELLPIAIGITRGYPYLTTTWSVDVANVCVSTNIIHSEFFISFNLRDEK
ncbi:hypothetical protein [Cognataquiflexum rubidum]|uniref:hypothetical protein n=1 Tax=Cognataquiflexum rubidum TaxID=2922273 RepID=UPI001F13B790|nr:hypothetical protein [Cognataquiflexum rubidum]MCH6233626.1 hypothetical protein [Cognataquiflexum rubidum]